ncbi:hypothetical protein ACEPAI_4981 [Sanghuangporus weigelae]
MAEAMRGALNPNSSGIGFTSHDIGGVEVSSPLHICKTWVAFGLFSAYSRFHGSGSYRAPFADYGEDASRTLVKFVETKRRLMLYIYSYAISSHEGTSFNARRIP